MAKRNKIIQSAKNKIQFRTIFRVKTGTYMGNKRHKVHISHSLAFMYKLNNNVGPATFEWTVG